MWGEVELEPEVEHWLASLADRAFGQAAFAIDLLAEKGPQHGEPYTRQLDGKLRELRLYIDGHRWRVSYFIHTERRIVLLTVFPKTARRESAEIQRAWRAMNRCLAGMHTVTEGDS